MKPIFKYLILPVAIMLTACFSANSQTLDGTWQSDELVVGEGNVSQRIVLYYAFDPSTHQFIELRREISSYSTGTVLSWVNNGALYKVEGDELQLNYFIEAHGSEVTVTDDVLDEETKQTLVDDMKAVYRQDCQDNVGYNVIYKIDEFVPNKKLVINDTTQTIKFHYLGNYQTIDEVYNNRYK